MEAVVGFFGWVNEKFSKGILLVSLVITYFKNCLIYKLRTESIWKVNSNSTYWTVTESLTPFPLSFILHMKLECIKSFSNMCAYFICILVGEKIQENKFKFSTIFSNFWEKPSLCFKTFPNRGIEIHIRIDSFFIQYIAFQRWFLKYCHFAWAKFGNNKNFRSITTSSYFWKIQNCIRKWLCFRIKWIWTESESDSENLIEIEINEIFKMSVRKMVFCLKTPVLLTCLV